MGYNNNSRLKEFQLVDFFFNETKKISKFLNSFEMIYNFWRDCKNHERISKNHSIR